MINEFEQLGITSCFTDKLKTRSITKATDIQRKVIPRLISGDSVFFTSATGTGKTFAYLLPLLEKLIQESSRTNQRFEDAEQQRVHENETGVKLLIVAPTLELCTQINSELEFLLKNTNLTSSLLIGSVSLERQIENLRKTKPDIITGNPNRLFVLAQKRIIKFNSLKYLVLDEADRLVSDEMTDDTNELCKIIFRSLKNKGCDLILAACSATMGEKCREKLLSVCAGKNISFTESENHEILREKIEHWAIFSEKRRKDQTLRSLLSALKAVKTKVKALVFTSRGDEAGLILLRLQHHRVSAAGLFGKINKKPISGQERKAALDSFRNGNVDVLVSTDLAARGLDIPGITHVIALDVPSDSEVYIHRCGRTGRAGRYGKMITIGDETQMFLLSALEKKLKIRVVPKELHYGKVCKPSLFEDGGEAPNQDIAPESKKSKLPG